MRLEKVAQRRTALVQRIAQQRGDLTKLVGALERPASYFDKAYTFAQNIKHQPKTLLVASLVTMIVFRRQLIAIKASKTLWKVAQWWIAKK
ncbi:MAG: hypothetical protein WBP13_09705 [Methylophilaceae bacterium]